jgi:hypothetical protein
MTQAVLIALIASHCGLTKVKTEEQSEVYIECVTKIVNCAITGDGSKIESKVVRKCLSETSKK